MSVNVSKFTKKKEGSTSVVVNNSSKGYSNTNNNNYNSNFGLDRQLWNIHDTGQDITETPTLPALNVNGQINAGGKIISNTEVNAPTGRFSYLYGTDIYGTNANISYITSEFITTDDLKVNNTAEIKNIISEHISTQYLDVTKSAHFAELVIDKIKSVGGSAVFSPADGFKIASEDDIIQICNSNGVATNYWMLCWDGEDDRGATVNMWERNDQALCQNFNEATVGTSHNISNTYFWMLVYTAGTYNPDNPSDIMYDHGSSETYINQSSYRQETAYNSEGEKITFDTLKHYIVVYNNNAEFTDATNNTEYVKDGIFNPKAGNEVVMLGHRARLDEMDDSEYLKRQSAIYIAAYNSTIEPDLMAPLIAQYQGINDFDLSSHRTTHFAAGHNDIFGYDNVIKGSFKTVNGTDITDLNGVTYFIKSDKAYIPVTSDWFIGNNSFNISLDCMYISGDNGPRYAGNRNSNMRLIIRYAYNGRNYSRVVYDTDIQSTYTFDLRALILSNTNGYIDNLSFEIAEYVNAQTGYTTLYQYNMPVIKQASNMPGDDAEFYKMNPIRELAQVNTNGDFMLYLQYSIFHIIGTNQSVVDDSTNYKIRFYLPSEDTVNAHTYHYIPDANEEGASYSSGIYTYNRSEDNAGHNRYYDTGVFDKEGQDFDLDDYDSYLVVELWDDANDEILDSKSIPVTLLAGALLKVTDSILGRVTSSETRLDDIDESITDHVSRIGQLELDSTKFTTDIAEINTYMNTYYGYITALQTETSYIHQYADSINTNVSNTYSYFVDGYTYITQNYSTITQTANSISLYVNELNDDLIRTGIDIEIGRITLNGDTTVNGELTLNSNEGFNLNNANGSLGAKIHGGEIPNISDWKSSTTADNEVHVWDSAYFSNTGTSQQFTITRNSVELGYHQPTDIMKVNYIAINCPFNISGVVKVDILDSDDSTILATKTSTIANVSGTRVYRATFSDLSYTSNQTARNYYIQYTFSLTGTPEINNYSFRTRISTTVTANSLVEIGSNGIATRIDSDDYMYMGGSAFEVRHGNNGIQVYNADGHIPASGQYGYGAKYYINNSGQRGWFPLNTPKMLKLSTSSFLWYNDDNYDMVITNYNSGSADVTIYLPTIVWPGRVCYVRKGGISNVEVLTSSGYSMFVKQNDTRTSVTITNGDMLMFIYGGSNTWYVNKLPNP